MAVVLTDAGIFIGGHDVSCDANQVAFDVSVAEIDTTTFCSNGWRTTQGGLKTANLTAQAFLEQSTLNGAIDPKLWNLLGNSTVPVTVTGEDPDTAGTVAYMFQQMNTSLSWGGAVGDAAMLNIAGTKGSTTMPVVRGQILAGRAARTASGNSAGIQFGALSATQRLWALMHVWDVTGTTPTLNMLIQSDDNSGFSSADTQITFTQATATTTTHYQASSVLGAETDTWWRASWTIGGTGTPTFNFVVAAGIATSI